MRRLLCLLAEWLDRRAMFKRAIAFNRQHAFRWSAPQWMCPTCHRIHKPHATSVFSGFQYPACCTFADGHRLDKQHATGL